MGTQVLWFESRALTPLPLFAFPPCSSSNSIYSHPLSTFVSSVPSYFLLSVECVKYSCTSHCSTLAGQLCYFKYSPPLSVSIYVRTPRHISYLFSIFLASSIALRTQTSFYECWLIQKRNELHFVHHFPPYPRMPLKTGAGGGAGGERSARDSGRPQRRPLLHQQLERASHRVWVVGWWFTHFFILLGILDLAHCLFFLYLSFPGNNFIKIPIIHFNQAAKIYPLHFIIALYCLCF